MHNIALYLNIGNCSVLLKISSNFLLFLGFLYSGQASAHEFWLEPINYQIPLDKNIRVHEKVGQDFKGNKYAYLASSYKILNINIGEDSRAVKSRLGDMPAINEKVSKEGLVILSAETTPSDVDYKTWEKFENFIKSKGLDWVLEAHKKRGLPEKNFVESYRRYAKAAIKVGHGKGKDRALGLYLEWVLETNPYEPIDEPIKAKLLLEGKPYAHVHVTVFNKISGDIIKTELTTDAEGNIEIPRAKGGQFLLNAVHMIEASKARKEETGAVWESLWASMTYELKPR